MPEFDYTHVNTPQPHIARRREILAKYPQIRELFGPTPSTALWTLAIVALQFGVAVALQDAAWWAILLCAWLVGAVCEHALYVIIHECTHNLVFKRPAWNKALALIANLPGVFPSAIGFRNYHLLHHRDLAEMGWDADIAGPKEAAWVGNSAFRKMLSLLFFTAVQGIVRPMRIGKINVLEPWSVTNGVTSIGAGLLVWYFFGWGSLIYLLLSCLFGLGLHPLGGRWIQEHYMFYPGQETYSYYGPLNRLCFNMGYHNEHHDFMMVPWSKLPKIRRIAPEFYDTLFFHSSWTKVVLKFIFDKNFSLYTRIVRPDHKENTAKKMTSLETEAINDSVKEMAETAPAG